MDADMDIINDKVCNSPQLVVQRMGRFEWIEII